MRLLIAFLLCVISAVSAVLGDDVGGHGSVPIQFLFTFWKNIILLLIN